MAKPGHPFDTEELDELRSKQRRLLRLLSPQALRAVEDVTLEDAPTDREEQLLTECVVRSKAKALLDRLDGGRVEDRIVNAGEARTLHAFLNRNRWPLPRHPDRNFFGEIVQEAAEQKEADPWADYVQNEPLVWDTLALLVIADQLAPDQQTGS